MRACLHAGESITNSDVCAKACNDDEDDVVELEHVFCLLLEVSLYIHKANMCWIYFKQLIYWCKRVSIMRT